MRQSKIPKAHKTPQNDLFAISRSCFGHTLMQIILCYGGYFQISIHLLVSGVITIVIRRLMLELFQALSTTGEDIPAGAIIS